MTNIPFNNDLATCPKDGKPTTWRQCKACPHWKRFTQKDGKRYVICSNNPVIAAVRDKATEVFQRPEPEVKPLKAEKSKVEKPE